MKGNKVLGKVIIPEPKENWQSFSHFKTCKSRTYYIVVIRRNKMADIEPGSGAIKVTWL